MKLPVAELRGIRPLEIKMEDFKMKRSIKETILRLALLFVGLTIAHLGVTLFLLTDLGADPFNVFVQGLFRTLQSFIKILTHGYTHVTICILIILVLLVVDRNYTQRPPAKAGGLM